MKEGLSHETAKFDVGAEKDHARRNGSYWGYGMHGRFRASASASGRGQYSGSNAVYDMGFPKPPYLFYSGLWL
jgi:hypothetical protein